MTEDFKKNLIDYVTNNLEETSPTDKEIIEKITKIDGSIYTNFDVRLANNMSFIGGIINLDEEFSNLKVIYGSYRQSMNDNTGFILICDGYFQPIELIDTYDTGTPCRPFFKIYQDTDGTFYGIDHSLTPNTNANIQNAEKRFIMLNNFLTQINGSRKLILRKSYTVPDSYKDIRVDKIFKNPNSADYVMCGAAGSSLYYSKVLTLKINVGTPSEWANYSISNEYGGAYVNFNTNNEAYIEIININTSNRTLLKWYKGYTATTFTNQTLYTFSSRQDIRQAFFINQNEFYFVVSPRNYYDNMHLMLGHYNNGEINFIYDYNYGPLDDFYNQSRWIFITTHKNELYYVYTEIADLSAEPQYQYKVYIQRYNGTWNPIKIYEGQLDGYNGFDVDIMNNYNLLTWFVCPSGFLTSIPNLTIFDIKEKYNINDYNGEPYVNSDVLVPKLSNLYSGELLVFSRNLYNVTKQNNQTMSSVEIPNTYLNDTEISQNDLISKTNIEMINNTTNWNKNIYEVVDVNFINTISVIDEDTNTPYLPSAIKVNNAITDGGDTNYQNTPCNKYRINYSDETTLVGELEWSSINKLNKTTLISFYADKLINSIDLISNDETTVYINIPVEVEVGKYYTINQKVRIGNKPIPVQLQYNNQDINYNNEPVMVYVVEEE